MSVIKEVDQSADIVASMYIFIN